VNGLKSFLLLSAVFFLLSSLSLSADEPVDPAEMTTPQILQELTEILTDWQTSLDEREQSLSERESDLSKREQALTEREQLQTELANYFENSKKEMTQIKIVAAVSGALVLGSLFFR
jgi:uncharacterized protein (DUF3084 family)